MSSMSTDSETSRPSFPNPYDLRPPVRRFSSDVQLQVVTPVLDDIPKFHSVDTPSITSGALADSSTSSSPLPRKMSVFLRVSSRHGKTSRAPSHHRVSHYGRPGDIPVPPEVYKVSSPAHSPTKSSSSGRRMSSAAALAPSRFQKQTSHDASGSVHHHARPSVTVNAHHATRRRMSMAASLVERPRKDPSPNPPSHPHSQARPQPQATSSNLKVTGSPTTQHGRQRPSVISRFRKFAFRQRGKVQESKKRTSTTTQGSSTGSRSNSPSLAHRRGIHHSYSRTDSSTHLLLEDIQKSFPWLDVVEHLVTSSRCTEPEIQARRRRACQDLIQALQQVYKATGSLSPAAGEGGGAGHPPPTHTPGVCLGTIFSDALTYSPSENLQQQRGRLDTFPALTRQTVQGANTSLHQALARLDFSSAQMSSFLRLGLEGQTVDEFLEHDSASPPGLLTEQHNQERLQFIHGTMAGLLHAPFSLMVFAGPVLTISTFNTLREIAWESLLDPDQELVEAAGMASLLPFPSSPPSLPSFPPSAPLPPSPLSLPPSHILYSIMHLYTVFLPLFISPPLPPPPPHSCLLPALLCKRERSRGCQEVHQRETKSKQQHYQETSSQQVGPSDHMITM